jgi:hypothetical protein
MIDTRKQAICNALAAFIRQRPGLDYRNYGNAADLRAEVRSIGKDLKIAAQLLRAVELAHGITADDMLKAADDGGRLSVYLDTQNTPLQPGAQWDDSHNVGVSWCTGQYWPTEYRAGVARYLASLLWSHVRDNCLPAADGDFTADPCRSPTYRGQSAGTWLRAHFRREFGRGIADRFFN